MNEITGPNAIVGEDKADTARRIRNEIKSMVKAGTLPDWKYSVRLSRFSMGSSIDVTIATPRSEWDGWVPTFNARCVKTTVEYLVQSYKVTRDSGLPDDYYWCSFFSNVSLREAS